MTTVIRWNPFHEIDSFQQAFNRAFENAHRSAPTYNGNNLALDAYESDTAYTLLVNLPGLNPDDISVKLHEDVLTISAEVPASAARDGEKALLKERASGAFNRSVVLPKPVNIEQIEATYENGVLVLTLPKAEEVQPKRITIKTPATVEHSQN